MGAKWEQPLGRRVKRVRAASRYLLYMSRSPPWSPTVSWIQTCATERRQRPAAVAGSAEYSATTASAG